MNHAASEETVFVLRSLIMLSKFTGSRRFRLRYRLCSPKVDFTFRARNGLDHVLPGTHALNALQALRLPWVQMADDERGTLTDAAFEVAQAYARQVAESAAAAVR